MKHPVDHHVGQRIRYRRLLLGMSQQQLADGLGLRFQQVQKYETGMNRVSASKLWSLAGVLGVPVGFFFEGLPDPGEGRAEGPARTEVVLDRKAVTLARTYQGLPAAMQRQLFALARTLEEAYGP